MNLIRKIIYFLAVLLCLAAVSNGEEKKSTANSNTIELLEEGAFRVMVNKPLSMGGYFRGARFDRSGMIPSVQFGKHHYFTTWESAITPENNCGSGPTEEFDLSGEDENFPPGYREAVPGEIFLKIGVGWLRKEANEEYNSYKFYNVIDPGIWTTSRTPKSVLFVHEPGLRNGYNYRYEKEILINGAEGKLIINHRLKNTGIKPIQTIQYCHNFILIDSEYVGTDYQFEINREPISGTTTPGYLQKTNSTWNFLQQLDGVIIMNFADAGKDRQSLSVVVSNNATGGRIRFSTKSKLEKIRFFAEKKAICPEPFISIKLAPGKEFVWSWEYEFEGN